MNLLNLLKLIGTEKFNFIYEFWNHLQVNGWIKKYVLEGSKGFRDIFQGSNRIKINVACVFVLQQLPQHIHLAVHSFFRFFFNYQCWTKVNKRDLFRRAEKLMWDVEYFWTVTNRKRTHLTKHKCCKTVKIVFSLFYHYLQSPLIFLSTREKHCRRCSIIR